MTNSEQKWPDKVWIVRHGESDANLARTRADESGEHFIGINVRDADVHLSKHGVEQAVALGHWFGRMSPDQQPTVILTSPFKRAMDTTEQIIKAAKFAPEIADYTIDERLREREYGVLEGITRLGIKETLPQEAQRRERSGKFYYRPPGGESWADVVLRLRSLLDTLTIEHRKERVLIVCHSIVIQCFRYLFERMTEDVLMDADRNEVFNCSVTSYDYDPNFARGGKMVLEQAYFVAPLLTEGALVTAEPMIQPTGSEPEYR